MGRCFASLTEMETAPKPGRGVPPKKDNPQAKKKVAPWVGRGGRHGARAPGRAASASAPPLPLETAAVLGGGHPGRRPRGAASEEGQGSGAATPEVQGRARGPEVSLRPEAPGPQERLGPEAAADPVWGEPGTDRAGDSAGERNRVDRNLPLAFLALARPRTRSQDPPPRPRRWPGSSVALTSPRR